MKFQICSRNGGLAFYEAKNSDEALDAFLRDMLHGMARVFDGPDAIHYENGRPAELTFEGEKFHAVPVKP